MGKISRQNKNKNKSKEQHVVVQPHPSLTVKLVTEATNIAELGTCVKLVNVLSCKNFQYRPDVEFENWEKIYQTLTKIRNLEKELIPETPQVEVSLTRKLEAFYDWVTTNGVNFSGIKIAQFDGYGLGLQATRDIGMDEPLFAIPRRLIFSEESVKRKMLQSSSEMTHLRLVYGLVLETFEKNSFWKPYLDLLPKEMDTVLYYTIEDIKELRYTTLFLRALKTSKSIARQYANIYEISRSIPDPETNEGNHLKKCFRYDLYRWCVSIVQSRQNIIPRAQIFDSRINEFESPKFVSCLIPFWDFGNHKQGRITSYYNLQLDQMESTAQNKFKKDEQVFMHYGNRSNGEFLLNSGFLCPDLKNDYIDLALGISHEDPLYEKRLKLLEFIKISTLREFKIYAAPDYISEQLLAFVRVFLMNEKQLDHWIESNRGMDLRYLDCALETELETKSWKYMVGRFSVLLAQLDRHYPNDKENFEKYKNGELELTKVRGLILEYRLIERNILKNALEYVSQRAKT